MNKIAITMGDPSGIGPEIIIKALNSIEPQNITVIGSAEVFEKTAANIMLELPEKIEFIDVPFDASAFEYGKVSCASGRLSFICLEKACQMAKNKEVDAIVTAPISKKAINSVGYKYSGQTEVLEKYIGTTNQNTAEMLFVANDFRVMLLTRHIKVADIPNSLNSEKIIRSIKILNKSLKKNFNLNNPKIALCGLNPHAGEEGLLGNEEKNIIIPAINKLNSDSIDIEGPFPADTLFMKAGKSFLNKDNQPYDCYVACYHDQGLVPIKTIAMDKTVNVTIGLPILRTSPAHGTAFDIAGKNEADYRSMIEAIKLAF